MAVLHSTMLHASLRAAALTQRVRIACSSTRLCGVGCSGGQRINSQVEAILGIAKAGDGGSCVGALLRHRNDSEAKPHVRCQHR